MPIMQLGVLTNKGIELIDTMIKSRVAAYLQKTKQETMQIENTE